MLNRELLLKALHNSSIEWRKHALIRMFERGITTVDAKEVLMMGEIIEEYPEDQPFPSALFYLEVNDRPLHVVAALDVSIPFVYVITVYRPTLDKFENDFKTRRN